MRQSLTALSSSNDIHEIKYGQAEEKLEAGGDEKLIFNFIWPYDHKQAQE